MVKFILLGSGRSGSSLITESLAEHPEVRIGTELFHSEEEPRRVAFSYFHKTNGSGHDAPHYRSGTDGKRFLEQDVFSQRFDTGVRAVGFKMFYVHARSNPREKTAWDYLISNKDIRVIHLIRTNLLEAYISLRIAFVTGEWERFKGSNAPRPEIPRLKIDPKACEAYFNRELVWRKWARKSFGLHPFMQIEYERDVCGRFNDVMNEIHDFLGVSRLPARQVLEKQSRRSPREATENYDELKDYFRYTLYEELFV